MVLSSYGTHPFFYISVANHEKLTIIPPVHEQKIIKKRKNTTYESLSSLLFFVCFRSIYYDNISASSMFEMTQLYNHETKSYRNIRNSEKPIIIIKSL